MLVTQANSTHSLAVINGQKTLIHSVMRFEAIQNATEKQLQHLLSSKLDNAKLDVLTVLYYIQLFHSIFKTNFGIMGILDGRNRKT